MTRPTLDSWAASLSFLHADVAQGLEPMTRRLGLLMDHPAPEAPGAREPNGYSGLARRGPFDRLLLTEWLLATEEPDEFMRRVVSSELAFLDLERSEQRPPSQFYVLVDTGADQVGSPRLAQLAALLVLCRRAQEVDASVSLGILGETAGRWRTGDAKSLLSQWLDRRSTQSLDPSAVTDWLATIDDQPSVTWVLAGLSVEPSEMDDGVLLLRTSEAAWNDRGATMLNVQVDDRTVDLPLPEPGLCIRILRGQGLFRQKKPTSTVVSNDLHFPRFHGAARRLLARAERSDELHLISVPKDQQGIRSKVKVKRLPGCVLAASFVGQRVAALIADGQSAKIAVVGKSLADVHLIDEPLTDIGLTEATINEIVRTDLPPLYFLSGAVVARIGDQWWHFRAGQPASVVPFAAMAGGNIVDQPRWARAYSSSLWVNDQRLSDDVLTDSPVHFGAQSSVAYQTINRKWCLHGRDEAEKNVVIPEGSNVLGVSHVESQPVLVLLSPGGHLLRLRGANFDRTLTKASRDGFADVSLHPTLPLLAIQRETGHIEVVDLETSKRLLHLQLDKA